MKCKTISQTVRGHRVVYAVDLYDTLQEVGDLLGEERGLNLINQAVRDAYRTEARKRVKNKKDATGLAEDLTQERWLPGKLTPPPKVQKLHEKIVALDDEEKALLGRLMRG